ncbi:hypothetical protein BDQ12DRAFT_684427 [Crucibulum laeve]|uniref:Uncharacterized protein n=1 Tax=Crucibulum laeve TaxID=68775 RepID=A0A5C3LXK4_9AGAR|nr:hypothetical protein BDQ12DRAFT_684427 [Crucibulum laeve]
MSNKTSTIRRFRSHFNCQREREDYVITIIDPDGRAIMQGKIGESMPYTLSPCIHTFNLIDSNGKLQQHQSIRTCKTQRYIDSCLCLWPLNFEAGTSSSSAPPISPPYLFTSSPWVHCRGSVPRIKRRMEDSEIWSSTCISEKRARVDSDISNICRPMVPMWSRRRQKFQRVRGIVL